MLAKYTREAFNYKQVVFLFDLTKLGGIIYFLYETVAK